MEGTHNTSDEFTTHENLILKILITCTSSLSVLATTGLFIFFCVAIRQNNFKFRMILYVIFCDFFSALGLILGEHKNKQNNVLYKNILTN